jgi:hypothetical protein
MKTPTNINNTGYHKGSPYNTSTLTKAWLLILTLLILTATAQAQTLVWQKCLGDTANLLSHDRFQKIIFSSDSNIIAAGVMSGGLLMKIDLNGNTIWQKKYGCPSVDGFQSVIQAPDGGYICVGSSACLDTAYATDISNGSADLLVIKTDALGNPQWQRRYGGTGYELGYDAVIAPDGNIIVASEGDSYNYDMQGLNFQGSNNRLSWITKIDINNGNLLYSRKLQQSYPMTQLIPAPPSQSQYWGVTQGMQSNPNFGFYKFDTAANLIQGNIFSAPGTQHCTSIVATPDSGFILAGTNMEKNSAMYCNRSDTIGLYNSFFAGFLMRMNKSGSVVWKNCYGYPKSDVFYGITRSQEPNAENYYAVGYSQRAEPITDVDWWLSKIDAQGNMLWQTTFGGSEKEAAFSVLSTHNGEIIIAGETKSNNGHVSGNPGANYDAWMIKVKDNTVLSTKDAQNELSDLVVVIW